MTAKDAPKISTVVAPSFIAASKDPVGHIYVDRFKDGLRFIIMRGPCSINAYVGIPLSHPLAAHSYEDLPVDAHGGLTFSREGKEPWPTGFWWYGWDYSHCDDLAFYDLKDNPRRGKAWTVEEIEKDSWHALYDFKKLLNLSENIALRRLAIQR